MGGYFITVVLKKKILITAPFRNSSDLTSPIHEIHRVASWKDVMLDENAFFGA